MAERKEQYFKIDIGSKLANVPVDRLKSAFVIRKDPPVVRPRVNKPGAYIIRADRKVLFKIASLSKEEERGKSASSDMGEQLQFLFRFDAHFFSFIA